jgi:hypothetical protein
MENMAVQAHASFDKSARIHRGNGGAGYRHQVIPWIHFVSAGLPPTISLPSGAQQARPQSCSHAAATGAAGRRGFKEKKLRRPAPEKWSITEIPAHLADSELVYGFRIPGRVGLSVR